MSRPRLLGADASAVDRETFRGYFLQNQLDVLLDGESNVAYAFRDAGSMVENNEGIVRCRRRGFAGRCREGLKRKGLTTLSLLKSGERRP